MKTTFPFVFAVLFFANFSQAVIVCSSIQKTIKGQPKYSIEFYSAGELVTGRNSFPTILFHDTELRLNQGYAPVTYSLCSAKPSPYALLVKCDSAMASPVSLLVENASSSGAFQDGPLKLFNMKCSR